MMDAQAYKPIIRPVRVGQGETIKLPNDGGPLQEITCDDIARLALAVHGHSDFFSLRRGLSTDFSRDINGSGRQALYIRRKGSEADSPHLIRVVFNTIYREDGECLYEADLIMDQRKDYEPSVNKGKHRFGAEWADIQIEWNSDEALQWRSDIDRLSKLPDTLTGWIEADLEMLVVCGSLWCNRAILTRSDLARHVAAGLTLENLRSRLKCSKCGKRAARVAVF